MVRRTKEEAQETRQQILEAAEKAFHARGVARTTLADIAKLEELVARMSFEGSGPDILSGTFRQRIRNQTEAIRSAERKAQQIEEAIGYLGAYGFDWKRAELTSHVAEIDFDEITFEGLPGSRR